jgi:hypothetical protein
MSYLSIPTYTMLSGNVTLPETTTSTNPPHANAGDTSSHPTFLLCSHLSMPSFLSPTPIVNHTGGMSTPNHHIGLVTTHAGHMYKFNSGNEFTPVQHWVVWCTHPPTILSVGLRVIIEGVEGKLKEVCGTKNRRIHFVFQLSDCCQVYLLLKVSQQFVQLPWHWKVWLRMTLYIYCSSHSLNYIFKFLDIW